MVDVGKRNILEEKTAQDVADSIREAMTCLNGGNAKTVYVFLKDIENRIEEAIRRIDETQKSLEEFLKTDGNPKTANFPLEDFLMISTNVKVDGKILSGKEKLKFISKRMNDCFRAKINWEMVLKNLQEDYLPIVEKLVRLCETPMKVEITNSTLRIQEIELNLDSLANDGLLDTSKMEILCSLQKFAVEYRKILKRDLTTKDLITFKRVGGKPYSKRAIEDAVAYANKNPTEK